jgi:hypothetical protein
LEGAYVQRLLREFVTPGGKLLIANYAEGMEDPARGCLPGNHATGDLLGRLAELEVEAAEVQEAFDAVKGRRVKVAVVRKNANGQGSNR